MSDMFALMFADVCQICLHLLLSACLSTYLLYILIYFWIRKNLCNQICNLHHHLLWFTTTLQRWIREWAWVLMDTLCDLQWTNSLPSWLDPGISTCQMNNFFVNGKDSWRDTLNLCVFSTFKFACFIQPINFHSPGIIWKSFLNLDCKVLSCAVLFQSPHNWLHNWLQV